MWNKNKIINWINTNKRLQKNILTTQDAARRLQRAFSKAHDKIISRAGVKTTTYFLGGIFGKLKTESSDDPEWAFVACSVGHCKAFCIHKEGEVVDITKNNYLYNYDSTQGGIGPVDGNAPNLGNMKLYSHMCNLSDIIILTTPGIHNNFHPQHIGLSPSDLKLKTTNWENISSERDKNKLSKFICNKMKEYCNIGKEAVIEPSVVIQNLLQSCYKNSSKARKYLHDNPNKTENDLKEQNIHYYMDHCTAFSIKALCMGSPSDFIKMDEQFSKEKIAERNRKWEWKAFIPQNKDKECFDIFAFLGDLFPTLENKINSVKPEELEECYLNLKNCDIEIKQEALKRLKIRFRTSCNNFTRVEHWQYIGEIDLESLKNSGKNTLLGCISGLLRRKTIDIRKINESITQLTNFNPSTDIYYLKGVKKRISLDKLGGKFNLAGNDLSITQSSVEFCNINSNDKHLLQIIEIHSQNESSLQKFIGELELQENWQICSYAEFMNAE